MAAYQKNITGPSLLPPLAPELRTGAALAIAAAPNSRDRLGRTTAVLTLIHSFPLQETERQRATRPCCRKYARRQRSSMGNLPAADVAEFSYTAPPPPNSFQV